MKKLSKIDLELMEKELPVLEQSSLMGIKGGYSDEKWACAFNCMEYVGSHWNLDATAQDYYKNFTKTMGYDPGEKEVIGRVYDPQTGRYNDVWIYTSVKNSDDIENFFIQSNFDYNRTPAGDLPSSVTYDNKQIAVIKTADGNDHMVIPLKVENGKMTYLDMSEQDEYGFVHKTSDLKNVKYVYDLCSSVPGDSGVIGMNGQIPSGFLSGCYDYGSSGIYS